MATKVRPHTIPNSWCNVGCDNIDVLEFDQAVGKNAMLGFPNDVDATPGVAADNPEPDPDPNENPKFDQEKNTVIPNDTRHTIKQIRAMNWTDCWYRKYPETVNTRNRDTNVTLFSKVGNFICGWSRCINYLG